MIQPSRSQVVSYFVAARLKAKMIVCWADMFRLKLGDDNLMILSLQDLTRTIHGDDRQSSQHQLRETPREIEGKKWTIVVLTIHVMDYIIDTLPNKTLLYAKRAVQVGLKFCSFCCRLDAK